MDVGSADKDAGNGSSGAIPLPKFIKNEKVLCFHGVLLYEAKVLRAEYREKEKEHAYWIHYMGWNKSWDEWIYEERVLKLSDENLARQKALETAYAESIELAKAAKLGTKPLGGNAWKSSTPGAEGMVIKITKEASGKDAQQSSAESDDKSRKKLTACVEPKNDFEAKEDYSIPMPEKLRTFFLVDWALVSQKKLLVKLPARISMTDILDEYLKGKEEKDPYAILLCDGLKSRFDNLLGSWLLFHAERMQYEELMKEMATKDEKERKKPSEIYGSAHLMRMFTKGGWLTVRNSDEDSMKLFVSAVQELIDFLVNNFEKYYCLEDYGVSLLPNIRE